MLEARQGQHVDEVFLVGVAHGGQRFVVEQVIVAVGQAETGLAEIDRIGVGILVVDADPHIEDAFGAELDRAHGARHVGPGLEMGDVVEVGLYRRQTAILNLLLVEEGVV